MSFVSKLFALGAALAVARADYISVLNYADSSCTVLSSTVYQQIGCQTFGSDSQQPVCSTNTMNLYSGSTTCAGTATSTMALATVNFGASGTCISRGSGIWFKWTCATGPASISSLPVGMPVEASFSDAGCKTITTATVSGCFANAPSPGMSLTRGCSATQIFNNVYSASTTCSGSSTQVMPQPLPGCTAAGSSGYQQTLCNAAPAKSGAVGVAAGLMAAAAAAAAVVALAA